MADAYIFIGPPGAGKGTLGDIFCEKTGVIHVSTGQLLRDEMAAGSDLGKQVKDIIAALTPEGRALQSEAADIPQQIGCSIRMQPEEAVMLHKLLNQLLSVIETDNERK